MQRLKIRYRIPISKLSIPSPVITRDEFGRITQKDWQYTSFYVRYDVTWFEEEAVMTDYVQTIGDGSAP